MVDLHHLAIPGKALREYEKGSSALARKGLGYICLVSRRMREATEYLSAASNVSPDDAESHAWLGGALYEAARYEDAERELRRALELESRL